MDYRNKSKLSASTPQKASSERSSRKAVHLILEVPAGKRSDMCRILKPLVREVRGLANLLDVTETADDVDPQGASLRISVPNYTVSSQELSAPALAVMLFLPECSKTTAEAASVRQKFLNFPWRYHHAIQLQSTSSPSILGQQEFYFLSRQLPLWSVSAGAHKDGVVVRFNIFVRRFGAMVEFYRLLTNSEMESRKPGFCVFPVNLDHLVDDFICDKKTHGYTSSRAALSCELALKHCPLVNPYPLTDACLSFPVSNLQAILNILPTQATPLPDHRYLVHDPDGNALVLFSSDSPCDIPLIPEAPSHVVARGEQSQHQAQLGLDKSSENGCSIDSGRYSDFETSSFELENCMSKLVKEFDLLKNGQVFDGDNSTICSQETLVDETEPTNLNSPHQEENAPSVPVPKAVCRSQDRRQNHPKGKDVYITQGQCDCRIKSKSQHPFTVCRCLVEESHVTNGSHLLVPDHVISTSASQNNCDNFLKKSSFNPYCDRTSHHFHSKHNGGCGQKPQTLAALHPSSQEPGYPMNGHLLCDTNILRLNNQSDTTDQGYKRNIGACGAIKREPLNVSLVKACRELDPCALQLDSQTSSTSNNRKAAYDDSSESRVPTQTHSESPPWAVREEKVKIGLLTVIHEN